MRKWPIICGAFGFVLLAGAIVRNRINARFANEVRERVISTLREHFAGEVQFADLQVSVFPLIVIHGYGLTVRQHGRTDVAPLIRIQSSRRKWPSGTFCGPLATSGKLPSKV